MKKTYLLSDQVNDYTPAEIVQALHDGIVTKDELWNNPDFGNKRRKQVNNLLGVKSHEEEWTRTCKINTKEAYEEFMENNPRSPYITEVRERIQQLHTPLTTQESNVISIQVPEEEIEKNTAPTGPSIDDIVEDIDKLYNDIKYLTKRLQKEDRLDEYIEERKKLFDKLYKIIEEYVSFSLDNKNLLLHAISENKNLLDIDTIRRLLQKNVFTKDDLINEAKIAQGYIKAIENNVHKCSLPTTTKIEPDRVMEPSTELYFWGIPGAGKTCVLASILSVINHGDYHLKSTRFNNKCNGIDYMFALQQIMRPGKVCGLVESTPSETTYEMGITITNTKDKNHPMPVTLIDMSGEVFVDLYQAHVQHVPENDLKQGYCTMKNLLVDKRSQSQKMHFFVIEYGAENKRDERGITQLEYLQAAIGYLASTTVGKNKKIFDDYTDLICIIITKSDKAPNQPGALDEYLDTVYGTICTTLEQISKNAGIKGGLVERVGFNIGEVCLQDYCTFDSTATKALLDIIYPYIWKDDISLCGKIKKWLKS